MREFRISKSKKGHPCLWQEGGGASNTGHATIIVGPNFEPLRALYVRGSGSLSNSEHSLHIVQVGFHIIVSAHHRRDFTTRIYRITNITVDDVAQTELVAEFSEGQWCHQGEQLYRTNINFKNAVEAAEDKAVCYHCRSPHYIAED